jgi:hypothetical protein
MYQLIRYIHVLVNADKISMYETYFNSYLDLRVKLKNILSLWAWGQKCMKGTVMYFFFQRG